VNDGDELDAEDQLQELQELLETLVEAFDVGDDGSVLEAVQHLAQRIVLRGATGLRVVVDAAGYRSRREEVLRGEADRVAERALSEGRGIAMRPMPAAERRYVHEYLRERGGVATHSEGDEPRRRLVVSPAV
jgi:spoIIIJ-associated protein